MKVKFWGTRGSLPAPCTGEQVGKKIERALKLARGRDLSTDAALATFINEQLPFSVRSTYGTNTSCVEIIRRGSNYILFDCGSGLRDFAQSLHHSGRLKDPAHFDIFISHLHWDHLQGFPFFVPAFLPGNTIVIHTCHPETEAAFRGQMAPPTFPVPFDLLKADIRFELHSPDQPFSVGGFDISMIEQRHPGKSYGYRFAAEGKAIVYSSDSEHKEDSYSDDYPFLKFFDSADLLIFDAMYSLADATFSKADWGHSSNITAVELAARSHVKRLALFHQEPTSSDEDLDTFLYNTRRYSNVFNHEARSRIGPQQYPAEIMLAYDGLEIQI